MMATKGVDAMGTPMKKLLAALCLTIITVECVATDFIISAVEILGYGTVEFRSSKSRLGYSKESMPVDAVEGVRFKDVTSDIPGALGTEFGVQYRINSSPKGMPIEVTSVILFPEGGLIDEKGKVYEQATETFKIPIGERSFYGFGFDEPWEIKPGKWVIQIWHNDSRLMQKTFNVLPQESAE
jgi:hypothetical protein